MIYWNIHPCLWRPLGCLLSRRVGAGGAAGGPGGWAVAGAGAGGGCAGAAWSLV